MSLRLVLLSWCILAPAVQAAAEPVRTLGPQEAVALADASRSGKAGRFEMVVAGTGRAGGGTFLNSDVDYRAPGDLTFRLSPNVAHALEKRFGVPPETYLRGKHVVVDGTIRRELIVNTTNGHVIDANRWQHTVRILFARQLVAID